MKFTIDKFLTPAGKMPAVREAIKLFKEYFTEGDLRQMFEENTGYPVAGDIIKCDVEAFAMEYDAAGFQVEIVVDGIVDFTRIRFFVDYFGCFSFHADPETITYRHFLLSKATAK